MTWIDEKAQEMVYDAMILDDDYEQLALYHARNAISSGMTGLACCITLLVVWLVRPDTLRFQVVMSFTVLYMLIDMSKHLKRMKRYALMWRDKIDCNEPIERPRKRYGTLFRKLR